MVLLLNVYALQIRKHPIFLSTWTLNSVLTKEFHQLYFTLFTLLLQGNIVTHSSVKYLVIKVMKFIILLWAEPHIKMCRLYVGEGRRRTRWQCWKLQQIHLRYFAVQLYSIKSLLIHGVSLILKHKIQTEDEVKLSKVLLVFSLNATVVQLKSF